MDDTLECANPLLLGWVKEWLDFAREKNTKGVNAYKHAYDSLKSCPVTFQHPSQLQQLKGFGPKICTRLTDKLKEHCQANGLPMPKANSRKVNLPPAQENEEPLAPPKKPRKKKPYVPTLRSGAYALIMVLATLDEDTRPSDGLTKAQLIEMGQPLCDASFTAPPDPSKFYTAWNSIKTLLDRDLVYEKGRPIRKYTLTDEGWEVAKRIQAASNNTAPRPGGHRGNRDPTEDDHSGDDDLIALDEPPPGPTTVQAQERPRAHNHVARPLPDMSYRGLVADCPRTLGDSPLPAFVPIEIQPGTFTVELLLDVREIRSSKDRDYMQVELSNRGVKPIMRSLELGDAQWVAKCHDPNLLTRLGAEGEEVVLDWIVERKRLDDLVASIRDGRFREQKFRLGKSGVKNAIYIVEEMSMDSAAYQRVEDAVTSALAQIQVVNGYFLKRTQKMDDTIRYLAMMTKMLKSIYEEKTLKVVPARILTVQNYLPLLEHHRARDPDGGYYISYAAFASLASKSDTLTLRDVFLKMLMTTRGLTSDKAIEIQKRWKTPHNFVKAFESCGAGEAGRKRKRALVASELGYLVAPRKKISKGLSERIAEIWGDA